MDIHEGIKKSTTFNVFCILVSLNYETNSSPLLCALLYYR